MSAARRPSSVARRHLDLAIEEAVAGATAGHGGPFGAVIVGPDGEVLVRAHNTVLRDRDPTAHAEVNAIRKAARRLGTHVLRGHVMYASCEPCPMCAGAVLWSRLDACTYTATRDDAAAVGFDDASFHATVHHGGDVLHHLDLPDEIRTRPFRLWAADPNATLY